MFINPIDTILHTLPNRKPTRGRFVPIYTVYGSVTNILPENERRESHAENKIIRNCGAVVLTLQQALVVPLEQGGSPKDIYSHLTLVVLRFRFSLKFQVNCLPSGTAVLKGYNLLIVSGTPHSNGIYWVAMEGKIL